MIKDLVSAGCKFAHTRMDLSPAESVVHGGCWSLLVAAIHAGCSRLLSMACLSAVPQVHCQSHCWLRTLPTIQQMQA